MTVCYIIVRELHGAASRMAFCRVKLNCCQVCHWHHWCLSFCSVLCTYWWLCLLLTSVSVIFYCMNVIVRWPKCHQAMILWTLEKKKEFLAVRTCNDWCTLSIFLVLCQESIARSWLTKVIHLMNVICVHTLFCGFSRVQPCARNNQVPRHFIHWAYASPWLRHLFVCCGCLIYLFPYRQH